MTHFPQPHPSRRASRVQLGDSVLAAIRLEDGRRTKAQLQTISAAVGLVQMSQSLGQGDLPFSLRPARCTAWPMPIVSCSPSASWGFRALQ
jgi:hypothetical protein